MFTEITRKRYAAGSYVDGLWVEGSMTESTQLASVQPIRGAGQGSTILMRLPEGVRTRGLIKVYTDTELRAADESQGIVADRIVWDGHDWEVQFVDNNVLGIRHYKAVCARVNA